VLSLISDEEVPAPWRLSSPLSLHFVVADAVSFSSTNTHVSHVIDVCYNAQSSSVWLAMVVWRSSDISPPCLPSDHVSTIYALLLLVMARILDWVGRCEHGGCATLTTVGRRTLQHQAMSPVILAEG
jgi:hypothetical protein